MRNTFANQNCTESAALQFVLTDELYSLLLTQIGDLKCLARLARVSKALSDPALDFLWKKLTKPSQIIRLLPEDVYAFEPDHGPGKVS